MGGVIAGALGGALGGCGGLGEDVSWGYNVILTKEDLLFPSLRVRSSGFRWGSLGPGLDMLDRPVDPPNPTCGRTLGS